MDWNLSYHKCLVVMKFLNKSKDYSIFTVKYRYFKICE